MSTLQQVDESRKRLAKRPRTPQGALGSRTFVTAYVVTDKHGRRHNFVRASLRELGFLEPPRWSAVIRRVRKLGLLCRPGLTQLLQAQLVELADVFRPVMKPSQGRIPVCHGGGILTMSVRAPSHRLVLDTDVVFERAA